MAPPAPRCRARRHARGGLIRPPVGTPEEVSLDLFEYADIAAWLVASPNWTSLQHLEAWCPRLARKTRVHCPHMFIVVPLAQGRAHTARVTPSTGCGLRMSSSSEVLKGKGLCVCACMHACACACVCGRRRGRAGRARVSVCAPEGFFAPAPACVSACTKNHQPRGAPPHAALAQ